MSWELQLDAASYIQFANNASLEAATKVHGAFSCTGKFLKDAAASSLSWLDGAAKADHSAYKCGLIYYSGFGQFCIYDSTTSIFQLNTHVGAALSTLGDATLYDVHWVVNDNAFLGGTDVCALRVFAAGDMDGTLIASWSTSSSVSVGTAAGEGVRWFKGIDPATGFGSVAGTFDWAKIGNDNTFSYENATMEEGSGSSVAPSGTITGTYSWINVAAIDHGVVTLPTNPVNVGAGDTATVVWYTSADNSTPASPQPSTSWTVTGAGATIDFTTGAYLGAYPGTAVITANTGIKNASATLTIKTPFNLLGNFTTP